IRLIHLNNARIAWKYLHGLTLITRSWRGPALCSHKAQASVRCSLKKVRMGLSRNYATVKSQGYFYRRQQLHHCCQTASDCTCLSSEVTMLKSRQGCGTFQQGVVRRTR